MERKTEKMAVATALAAIFLAAVMLSHRGLTDKARWLRLPSVEEIKALL